MAEEEPKWRVSIVPTGTDEWYYQLSYIKNPETEAWGDVKYWSEELGIPRTDLKGHTRNIKKARKEAERVIDRVKAAWKHQHGITAYVDADKNIHFSSRV